jgi:Gpi18-like mannosyltransferase
MASTRGAGRKPAPLFWRDAGLRRAAALFVLWWVIIQGFAVLAFARFQLSLPDQAYTWTSQIRDMLPLAWHGFAALHARFDSGFYQMIAMGGYTAETAAFLPLYPLLMRVVTLSTCGVLPCTAIDAAFVVSNLSALGAACAVFALARADGDDAQSNTALFYWLIFPSAFFLTANYTESTFVLLAAPAFIAARHGRWGLAGAAGALARLTRATGFALFVALGVEWWRQGRVRRGLWLLLIPAAFAGFQLYLAMQGLSFFDTQYRLFHRVPWSFDSLPDNLDWEHLITYPAAQANLLLDSAIAMFVMSVSAWQLWRGRASYGVYGLLCILLPLSSGQALGLNRFALAAFTVPLALAGGRSAWLDRAYTLGSTLLLALYTMLYVQGYWAG